MPTETEDRAALLARIEALERRVQLSEDLEAIRTVTARYCLASDRNGDGPPSVEPIAECFTQDGVWDGGPLGRFEGIEGFRRLWAGAGPFQSTLAIHRAANPIIAVDGDSARGQWHVLALTTIAGEALWTAGRYDNEYRRTPQGWKIRVMNYTPWLWSRHSEGWAREPFWNIAAAGA